MWPGAPVPDTEDHRQGNHNVGEKRVDSAAEKEIRQSRIGRGDEQASEYSDCGESSQPLGQGIEQLAAIFETHKRGARPGKRKKIYPDQPSMLQHVPAVPQMPGEISIRVQERRLQRSRHHHGQ